MTSSIILQLLLSLRGCGELAILRKSFGETFGTLTARETFGTTCGALLLLLYTLLLHHAPLFILLGSEYLLELLGTGLCCAGQSLLHLGG